MMMNMKIKRKTPSLAVVCCLLSLACFVQAQNNTAPGNGTNPAGNGTATGNDTTTTPAPGGGNITPCQYAKKYYEEQCNWWQWFYNFVNCIPKFLQIQKCNRNPNEARLNRKHHGIVNLHHERHLHHKQQMAEKHDRKAEHDHRHGRKEEHDHKHNRKNEHKHNNRKNELHHHNKDKQ